MDQITPGETSIKGGAVILLALHRQANELRAELLLHTMKGMLGLLVMADLDALLQESWKRCLWRKSDYQAVGGWAI